MNSTFYDGIVVKTFKTEFDKCISMEKCRIEIKFLYAACFFEIKTCEAISEKPNIVNVNAQHIHRNFINLCVKDIHYIPLYTNLKV